MDQLCVRYWTKCFVNVIIVNPCILAYDKDYHHFIDEKIESPSG